MTSPYDRCRVFSDGKLTELRTALAPLVPNNDMVVTCGSYARREASGSSDIDFFIVTHSIGNFEDQTNISLQLPWVSNVKKTIASIVEIDPSAGGAFAKVDKYRSMLSNIGGDHDTNQKITRRMLFLLEGEALYNPALLRKFRREMLERYISDKITDHQLALFLLNDIIRYYRTMAIDYEFKTQEDGKPWGIRNIKLVFSRKLLYASGLFAVAATADRMRDRKIQHLETLFDLPVIDRMSEICGRQAMSGVMTSYNYFLDKLESRNVREHLKKLDRTNRDDSVFRDLKNEGHYFTRELLKLFENTFDSTHPIRRAVIF